MARVHGNIFDNFSEEALEALDFARCQRADGTYYGTSGQCRKGKEAGDKPAEAPKAKPGRAEKIAKLRAAVDEAKKTGDKKKLKDLRHDLQILEKTAKLESQAKKTGRSVDDIARERNERATAKVREAVAARYPNLKKASQSATKGEKPVPPANDVKEMTDRLKKTFVGGNGETRPWTKDHQAVWDRILSATDTKALGSLTRKLNKEVFDNGKYNVNAGFLKNSLGIMKEWLQANQRSGAGAKREAELANMTPEERRRARTADAIQRGIKGGVVNPRMR